MESGCSTIRSLALSLEKKQILFHHTAANLRHTRMVARQLRTTIQEIAPRYRLAIWQAWQDSHALSSTAFLTRRTVSSARWCSSGCCQIDRSSAGRASVPGGCRLLRNGALSPVTRSLPLVRYCNNLDPVFGNAKHYEVWKGLH